MGIGRKHDATGRSTGRIGNSRLRKKNGPPQDQPWVWLSGELLASPAWRALTGNARMVIDRILIEHMRHGGAENGFLPVTYADFVSHGVRRNSILPAIKECEALGLIQRVPGLRARSQFKGSPQTFRIAWLPTSEGGHPTNLWRAIKGRKEAAEIVRCARNIGVDSRRRRSPVRADTGEDIDSRLARDAGDQSHLRDRIRGG
jgi:hypothetical protein